MTVRRSIAIAAVVGLSVLVGPSGSQARDQGTLGPVTPTKTFVEQSYPPMPGIYPHQGAHAFAYFRPPTCRAANYCDAINLLIDYPPRYIKENFFRVTVTLTWDNHLRDGNPTGNDMDLFVWGDDGPAAGGPAGVCGSPGTAECNTLYPESFTLTEPSTGPVFLTVVNHQGINTGYKLTAEFERFEVPPPPEFIPPEREISSDAKQPGQRDFRVTGSKSGGPVGPSPTPRVVLVPGPDGELIEQELPVLAASSDIDAIESGGLNPLVPIGGATAAVAAVVAGYLFWWRRRSRDTA